MTKCKTINKPKEEESESGKGEDFEDSRETLPPMDPKESPSAHNSASTPDFYSSQLSTSTSSGQSSQVGMGQDIVRGTP